MRFNKAIIAIAVGGLLWAALAASCRADTIQVSFVSTASELASGLFKYEVWETGTPGKARVQTGDFFTVYDFYGFIPGSQSVVANWVQTAQSPGVTPPDVNPPDLASTNLTWTYRGATPIDAPTLLGVFSAKSVYTTAQSGWYASQDRKNVAGTWTLTGWNAETVTPNPGGPSLPLPAASWSGLALIGLVVGLRKLRHI